MEGLYNFVFPPPLAAALAGTARLHRAAASRTTARDAAVGMTCASLVPARACDAHTRARRALALRVGEAPKISNN